MKVSDFVHEMQSTSVVFGRQTGVYVTFEGDVAFTDGKRINLPSMGLDNNLTLAQVKAMRGYVDHEAGHVRHSDMPLIMDFYSRCGNNKDMDLKNLHNLLEDVWMEDRVLQTYPGSKKNLAQTNEMVSKQEVESWVKEGLKTFDDTYLTAGICIRKLDDKYSGPNFLKARKFFSPQMLRWSEQWLKLLKECENSQDTIDLAMAIKKFFEDNSDNTEEAMEQGNPEDFDPKGGDPFESVGEPGKGSPSQVEGKGEDGQRIVMPKDFLPSIEDALTAGSSTGNHDGQGAIGGMDGPLVGGYRVYTTQDDVVYKRGGPRDKGQGRTHEVVNSTEHHLFDETKSKISGSIHTMKNKLRRSLMAKQRIDRDPGREMGRLDSKRLVAAATGAQNVFYQRIDRSEVDTTITILIDLSGSMGGRKAEVARDTAVALTECLEGARMPYKIVGFCNKAWTRQGDGGKYHRRTAMDTVIFKDFTESLRVSKAAISKIPEAVGGDNSDYDFIAQELSILSKRQERRKVLFVLSDGHPAHASDASQTEIIRHCKEAITKAGKEGVECIGIGICDDSVQKIYKDNVVVHDVKDLSGAVFNKLTQTLVGK